MDALRHLRVSSLDSSKYVALFDYEKKNTDELNVITNDQILILIVINSELYLAKNIRTNQTGFVKSKLLVPHDSLELKQWYFGKYSKLASEKLLLRLENSSGTYLIRENDFQDNTLTLSILFVTIDSRCVKHYKINKKKSNGFFYLKEKVTFKSIDQLIEFYSKDAKGLCCPLGKVADKLIKRKKNNELHHSDIFIYENSNQKQDDRQSYLGLILKQDAKIVVKSSNSFNISEFLSEIEIMKEIEHKNIIRIIATSINLPRNILICTELMINNDLCNYLKVEKKLNKAIIIRILRQITSAILYLIKINIVHRDLKCKNIFIGNNYFVKLGNFGLARKLDTINKQFQIRSNIEENISIRYTAPELIASNFDSVYKIYNEKTEVWSFGVLFYEILTNGELPYKSYSQFSYDFGFPKNYKKFSYFKQILDFIEAELPDKLINQKYRLPKPVSFNDEDVSVLYEKILLKCWADQQALRPSISQLNEIFINYFDLLEPEYKFEKSLNKQMNNYSQIFEEVIEVNSDEVKMVVLIKGNYVTEIWKGCFRFDDLIVSVKKYNLNEQENFDLAQNKFFNELKIMKKLKHPNIIKLFAISSLDPYYLIYEYMKYGPLSEFLTKTHFLYSDEQLNFDFNIIISIAQDVSNGMRYLGYLNLVHRDLCAKNIMIGEYDVIRNKYIVKIAGFERSIFLNNLEADGKIDSNENYISRWSAPETVKTLSNKNPYFSVKSDVYSFGIVLYELVTKGSIPFKEFSNEEVFEKVFLGNYIMGKPIESELCSDEYYYIMKSTWDRNPNDRPNFFDLHEIFSNYYDLIERDKAICKKENVKFKQSKSNFIKQFFSFGNVKKTYRVND